MTDRTSIIASLILTALADEELDDEFAAADLWSAVRHAIDPRPTVAEVAEALELLQDPDVSGVLTTAAGLFRAAPDIDDALVRLHDVEDDGFDPCDSPAFIDADDRY